MKFLILILLFPTLVMANDKIVPKESRWERLMRLIKEEEIAIKRISKKSDQLSYRLFELETEKIKLYKDKENKKFMQLKMKFGSKVKRKNVFTQTLRIYSNVEKMGLNILKKYPFTRYKADIYHTLALNSRDYAYDKKEEKYLRLALKYAPKYSEIEYFAKTSLAEFYYNNKKYPKAVKLYKYVIKNKNDEWYTKNLYNYGWCLLKIQLHDKAIATLEEAYHLSQSGKYINFKEQILRSLVSFYVIGDKVEQGKSFILENEKEPFPHVFRLMKKVADKGRFQSTEKLIAELESMVAAPEKKKDAAELKMFQLAFYQKYKEHDKMLNVSRQLVDYPLDKDQKEDAIHKLTHTVGLFQMTIKKDFTKYDYSYDINKLELIKNFFAALTGIDKDNKAAYEYYVAETLFALHELDKAMPIYKQAFESYLKVPSPKKDIRNKSLKAIMACLDGLEVEGHTSQETKDKMIEYTYHHYTSIWPKDELSQKIYPKFYYLYMNKKQMPKARIVLDRYIKNFKKDLKNQQELYRQLMDHYIKTQDTIKIAEHIAEMEKGFLNFGIKEVKKAEKILATILFTKYQEMNKNGNSDKALAGYKSIFFNNKYPQIIKADAAFNMGIIFTDQVESQKAIKWFAKSVVLYPKKEKLKKRDYLEKLSTRMYLLQDFLNSAKLGKMILRVYCKSTPKKNLYTYQQAIRSDLANDYVTKSLYSFDKYRKCIKGEVAGIQKEMIQHFYLFNHESTFIDFVEKKEVMQNHNELAATYIKKFFWKRYSKGQNYQFLLKKLQKYGCANCKSLRGQIKQLHAFMEKVEKFPRKRVTIGETFQMEKFNKQLEARILSTKPLVEEGNSLLKFQNPEISLQVLNQLTLLNNSMAKELVELKVPGPKQFQKQFEDQMKMIAANFTKEARSNMRKTNRLMEKNEIFSQQDIEIRKGKEILDLADIRTPASNSAVTFDLTKK
jgi:hypothetical protein